MVQDKEILVSEVSEEWVKKMWVSSDRKSRWSAMAENYIFLDEGGNTDWKSVDSDSSFGLPLSLYTCLHIQLLLWSVARSLYIALGFLD